MEYGIIEFTLIVLLLICMMFIIYKLRNISITKTTPNSYISYERIEQSNDYTTVDAENYIIEYIDDEF